MRRGPSLSSRVCILLLLGLCSLLCALPLVAQAPGSGPSSANVERPDKPKYRSDRVFVRFRPNVSQAGMLALHQRLGSIVVSEPAIVDRLQVIQLQPGLTVAEAVRRYRADPSVLYAEPDYVVQAFDITPNDPQFPAQWNLHNTGQNGGVPGADLHAPQAWALSTGASGVVVAVLDTGIDYTHPDLVAQVWGASAAFMAAGDNGVQVSCPIGSHGLNAVDKDCDPMDDNGHGTHVSGIIGAAGNNGLGVSGVNWNVTILPCKFLDATGAGDLSSVIGCLSLVKALKDSGVNIVATNNSWGGFDFSQALQDAIAAQLADGILFITAAGNNFSDNDRYPVYPANISLPNVISVAATDRKDNLVTFSDEGRHTVHIGAPGDEILSTTPNDTYSVLSGTSMSAPHVAGVAALLKAYDSSLDWRAIKNLILAGGDANSSLANTISQRRLNAFGSLSCSNSFLQSRLLPIQTTISGSVGTAITLSALNINCAQPGGPVTVQVSPSGQSIVLQDDGNAPDQIAGDGIYTGQWTPPTTGSFQLTFPDASEVNVEVLDSYSAAPTAFNYRTITGTNLNLSDDAVAEIKSPFVIPFGGGSFSSLYVSSNGTISFTDPFFNYDNLPLDPDNPVAMQSPFPYYVQRPTTLIAPFWMDLSPIKGTNQNVFWQVTGNVPNRELVVEWRNVRSFACLSDANATVTFQVVLQEGSRNVLFNYSQTEFGDACTFQDDGASASIGLQTAPTSSVRLGLVASGTALLWQSPPSLTASPVPVLTSISPNAVPYFSPTLTLTVTGSGFVNSSLVEWNSEPLPTTYVSSTQLTAIIPSYFLIKFSAFTDFGQAFITVFNASPGGGTSQQIQLVIQDLVPTITSISPSSIEAGSFGFSVVVTGNNLSTAFLQWNGQPLQSGPLDNNHLIADIPTSLLTTPGTFQITAFGPPPGGGLSNALTFTVTSVAPTALAGIPTTKKFDPQLFPVSRLAPLRFLGWNQAKKYGPAYLKKFSRPYGGSAAVASSAISSYPSAPSSAAASTPNPAQPPPLPGFAFHPTLPSGFIPTAVATGDFNGDGKMDWVVANGGGNDLWIYFGKGDGTAAQPVIIHLLGQSPVALAAVELRKNGILDLVVAEADSSTVGVLLGHGDGTFDPETQILIPGFAALSVTAGDFNSDGNMDLVVGIVGTDTTGPVVFLPGDGKGSFGNPVLSPNQSYYPAIEYATTSIVAADINGDGLLDFVVVDLGAPTPGVVTFGIYSYLNNGDGTFKFAQQVAGDGTTIFPDIAVGDLNEDGCPDIAAVDVLGATWLFPGNCDGTFQNTGNSTFFKAGAGDDGASIALGDVNGDGHLDVVLTGAYFGEQGIFGQVAGNLVSVMLGDGHGNLGTARIVRGERSMYGLALADLNGDGRPDIVTANQDTDTASVFLNDGKGFFPGPTGAYIGYPPPSSFNAPYTNFLIQDLNGDGKSDLSLFEWPGGYVDAWEFTVLLNDGTGKFGAPIRSPGADSTDFILDYKLGDFRNSGRPDLLVLETAGAGAGPASFVFSPNKGNGQFGPAQTTTVDFGTAGTLATGDFDHDGKLDVVVGSLPAFSHKALITVYHGNGDGTFTSGFTTSISNGGQAVDGVSDVTAVDCNLDGKLDLLVVGNDDNLYELLGNGDGTFGTAKIVMANIPHFLVADLNGDGLPDIITYGPSAPSSTGAFGPTVFSVYLGQPDGTFKFLQSYQPYGSSSLDTTLLADFNGDGNLDVGVVQYDPSLQSNVATNFRIMLGNGDGTFTPTYAVFPLEKFSVPQSAADVDGDGRADLIELDGFPASFHVIPAASGPALQLALRASPIVGQQGLLEILLSLPSNNGTAIQLLASDPNIQIPATISMPAGSLTAEVPFTIAPAYDSSRVLTLTAQLGSQTATISTYETNVSLARFQFVPTFVAETVPPSGSTGNLEPAVVSIGGYAATLTFSCQGLPLGATCTFGTNSVVLPAGQQVSPGLFIQAGSNTPLGLYPVQVIATDGFITSQFILSLNVADFTLSLSPASVNVVTGNSATFTLTVGSLGNWTDLVGFTCQISPPSLPGGCGIMQSSPSVYPLGVSAFSAPVGDYTITVIGTADGVTHSSPSAILHVQGATIASSSSSATISVGSSATFNVMVQSENGLTDQFTFTCPGLPAGISCAFNPASSTLPPNGTLPTVLTVNVAARPAVAVPLTAKNDRRSPPLNSLLLLVSLLALLAEVSRRIASRRMARPLAVNWAFLATIALVLALGLGSCGGAGTSSVSSNPIPPPPPPPPPPPIVESISVQATSNSITLTITSLTITIP